MSWQQRVEQDVEAVRLPSSNATIRLIIELAGSENAGVLGTGEGVRDWMSRLGSCRDCFLRSAGSAGGIAE